MQPEKTHAPVRTAAKVRYIAPDVARGLALLGISLANLAAAWLMIDADHANYFGGVNGDPTVLEQILIVFQAMFVHVRGLPMFSTLLGVGVGMILVSLYRRGFTVAGARKVIARRYAFLALFGAIHMIFVFYGDIMLSYGLAALILALLIGLEDKWLKVIAYCLLGLWGLFGALGIVGSFAMPEKAAAGGASVNLETYPDLLSSAALMLAFQPFIVTQLLPIIIIGFIWGRNDVFADIDGNKKMLQVWAAIAIAVILLIGVPWGLSACGILPYEWETGFAALNELFGILTGPGILAIVALMMQPVQRKLNDQTAAGQTPKIPTWLAPFNALGKRSMSGYLAQSIIYFVIAYPFMLNLFDGATIPVQMLAATGVWVVTLLLAWGLEAAGKPGPFEKLHRRLSYGRDGLPDRYTPTQREIEKAQQQQAMYPQAYPQGYPQQPPVQQPPVQQQPMPQQPPQQ